MAEQGEARTPVHLPLEHLRARFPAFGPAVVVRHGERGNDSVAVGPIPRTKECTFGRSAVRAAWIHSSSLGGICRGWLQEDGKRSHQAVALIPGHATTTWPRRSC